MATRKSAGPAQAAPASKPRTDWEAVHRDFRTGKFTHRELADKYGVSRPAVTKQARVNGWTQDLTAQIKQATNAKLVAELVTKEVTEGSQKVADTVIAAAELNKAVILKHRRGLKAAGEMADGLLDELQGARLLAEDKELLAQLLAGKDAEVADIVQAQQIVAKALGLGSRVDTFKKLAEALTKLHVSERIAFGLDEKSEDDDQTKNPVAAAVADLIAGIHGNRSGRLRFAEARK